MRMRFANSETAHENSDMIIVQMFIDPRKTRFSYRVYIVGYELGVDYMK